MTVEAAKRIGFLGTGHIAAPMARALARDGHTVTVSERNAETAASLAKSHAITVAPNQGVLDGSDIVFLTLRPGVWEGVVAPLTFRPDHRIVSAMAGPTLAQIATATAPATDISLTIPLGHIEHGGCPLPVFPASGPMADLFGAQNPIITLTSETDLTAYFSASTVLTAALSSLIATSEWLAAETGDAGDAEAYAQALTASYLSALPGSLDESRAGLTYPKTLNRAMLDALTDIDLEPTIKQALTDMTAAMRAIQ